LAFCLFVDINILKLRNYAYFCQPFGEEEFPLGINNLSKNTALFLFATRNSRNSAYKLFYQHG
jgi:hypothetical protein